MNTKRKRGGIALLGLLLALLPLAAQGGDPPPPRNVDAVRKYIHGSWATLTRSLRDLPTAARDPKMHKGPSERWPVYLAPTEDRGRIEAELRRDLDPGALATIELVTLPANPRDVTAPGLLFLPHPYVVPGGRFNEMYGWDSYFIQVGLLLDGELELARGMTDNFVYEIERYGTLLNANRTYYLTRSQPPFLTQMILGVYRRTHDLAWLRSTRAAVEAYHRFWTTEPHLDRATGLSRYYDLGEGPAPEVLSDERDAQGRTHYDRVREFYRTHDIPDYDLRAFYDARKDQLTDLFYKGDRSMRESGFDPSNRFGPFNADIIHYVPVCLNALLYQMEVDTAEITAALGDPAAAKEWTSRAEARRSAMERYLWDPGAGLYLDYNVVTGMRRHYEYATTFYPLWAGVATPEEAARVEKNLPRLEAEWGLLTSTRVTGSQWDAPFGWAPLQLMAVRGLRRYGYPEDADRLSRKFIALVARDFELHGTIVEKYDVRRGRSDIAAGIQFGYSANQIGFGWTNAAFLELLAGLTPPSAPAPASPRAPASPAP